jgi:mevalonate kinase
MPAIISSAPGKIILCGEHAVVYGRPAIALPVLDISTTCRIFPHPNVLSEEVIISAPSINLKSTFCQMNKEHPIRKGIELVLSTLSLDHIPNCEIELRSTIPDSSGLGSSSSLAVALIRGVSSFLGHPFEDSLVSQLAFEVEKIYHGSPSGIDNSVVSFAKPLYFVKGFAVEFLLFKNPLTLVIANTGIKSSTAKVVAELKHKWELSTLEYENQFDQISEISKSVKKYLESGDLSIVGKYMVENHKILKSMGISCKKLDELVDCALQNGAFGAKLSGGGQGGNMIAVVSSEHAEDISISLRKAGAVSTIIMRVPASVEVSDE